MNETLGSLVGRPGEIEGRATTGQLTSGVAKMISTLCRRSTIRMVAVWPCRSALAQAPVPVELLPAVPLPVGPKKPIDQCRHHAGPDRSKDADVYFWIQRLTERFPAMSATAIRSVKCQALTLAVLPAIHTSISAVEGARRPGEVQ
jgi:hypothetical protein